VRTGSDFVRRPCHDSGPAATSSPRPAAPGTIRIEGGRHSTSTTPTPYALHTWLQQGVAVEVDWKAGPRWNLREGAHPWRCPRANAEAGAGATQRWSSCTGARPRALQPTHPWQLNLRNRPRDVQRGGARHSTGRTFAPAAYFATRFPAAAADGRWEAFAAKSCRTVGHTIVNAGGRSRMGKQSASQPEHATSAVCGCERDCAQPSLVDACGRASPGSLRKARLSNAAWEAPDAQHIEECEPAERRPRFRNQTTARAPGGPTPIESAARPQPRHFSTDTARDRSPRI